MNIWVSFGCQLLTAIPSCHPLTFRNCCSERFRLPTVNFHACKRCKSFFLSIFNSHLLFLVPVLSDQWQKPQEMLPCEGKSLETSSPALIFALINEFRWRETGDHSDPCGNLYQPPLLSAGEGFGPTSYKFFARLVLPSKKKKGVSLLWKVVLWCWIWHSSAIASHRHIISALLGSVNHH